MKNERYLSISEFSKLTTIPRTNLIYYDNIGLLKAEKRGVNNYRFYNRRQIESAFMIYALRSMDISIEEIKAYESNRTPQKMIELFKVQDKHIQAQIQKMQNMKQMMKLYTNMVHEIEQVDISQIYVIEKKAEPIYLGTHIPIGSDPEEASIAFYNEAFLNEIEISSPFGTVIDKDILQTKSISSIKQFYFKQGKLAKHAKPQGTYVVGYIRGDYHNSDKLYQRLFVYIEEHGLRICGDGYEESPYNEVSTQHTDDFITKIEIMVESISK